MNPVIYQSIAKLEDHGERQKRYRNPFDGMMEALAKGVYEAPGQLGALFDEFSPIVRLANAARGSTLQADADALTGNNWIEYDPNQYQGNKSLQGLARLMGNISGDPLNALPIGMVGKAGVKQVASTLADEAGRTGMRNQLGMLAGPNAKNADLGMLARAQEMKAQGVPTDDIYSETKWWLDHPDGVPRFEIDDSGFGYTAELPARDHQGNFILSDSVIHPELYKNYPDVGEIPTSALYEPDMGGFYETQYRPKSDLDTEQLSIIVEGDYPEFKRVAGHEIQHAIQSREGLARGGNPAAMGYLDEFELAEKVDPLKTAWEDAEILVMKKPTKKNIAARDDAYDLYMGELSKYNDELRKLTGLDNNERYRRLAGEAESRLVERRMNMSMDERLANPFYKGYDVPLEDQIVRFDDGPSMSTKSQLGAVDLPMDEASRMARAREMGMDLDQIVYRGSSADEKTLGNPQKQHNWSYGHLDENIANRYARSAAFNPETNQFDGANVMPLFVNKDATYIDPITGLERPAVAFMDNGEVIIKKPSAARSIFAKFDPAKKDSADLLASKLLPIPAGLLGLTTLDPEN